MLCLREPGVAWTYLISCWWTVILKKDGNKQPFQWYQKRGILPILGIGDHWRCWISHTKFFTRMMYKRVKPVLQAQQSKDQIGFRSFVGVGDAFAVSRMCVQSLWNGRSRYGVQVWICGKLLTVLSWVELSWACRPAGGPFRAQAERNDSYAKSV